MVNCQKCYYYEKIDVKGWDYCNFFEDQINEKTLTHIDECFAYELGD